MKNWQYMAIQSNLMIVLSMVSTFTIAKVVFMLLAIAYLIGMVGELRE